MAIPSSPPPPPKIILSLICEIFFSPAPKYKLITKEGGMEVPSSRIIRYAILSIYERLNEWFSQSPPPYDYNNPYQAKMVVNKSITAPDWQQDVSSSFLCNM